jgi:valyl-tRNA synthetase
MILHPIMPFMTEEIWHITQEKPDTESISTQPAPIADTDSIDIALEEKFEFLQLIIEEIRRLRGNLNIPPQQKAPVAISANSAEMCEFLQSQSALISIMGRLSEFTVGLNLEKPASALASVVRDQQIYLVLNETIDLSKEKERLNKEIERLERNIGGTEKKLANESFVAKAPANLVAYEREKLESMKDTLAKVRENLKAIGN